jgi:ABC-type phosphate transport system substrate-binding protein
MITQFRYRRLRGHCACSFLLHAEKTTSLRTLADKAKRRSPGGRPLLAAALLCGALLAGGGCGAARVPPTVRVRVTGAQIATELVESWLKRADAYSFQVTRAINPTWSQVGFQSLARGQCDLACTDRPVEQRELDQFGDQEILGYRVAFYGYALYVHPDNPLDSIFSKHIGLVFKRQVTDWSELAGPDGPALSGPIRLYGPPKVSRGGDILMRQANIWFGQPTWEVLPTDQDIVNRVAADPLALGFASIGFDQEARYLGLRMQRRSKPAFPSLEEFESERYGLAKVVYVYFVAPPNPAVSAALEYLFSKRGQQVVAESRIWPLPWDRAPVAPPP